MKSHIDNCNEKLRSLTEMHTHASCVLSDICLIYHIKFINFYSSVISKTKDRTRQKLSRSLSNNIHANSFPCVSDKYVTNLSSVVLPIHEKEALSLGFNFSVPYTQISLLDIDAQFENLYDQLSPLVPTTSDNQSWLKAKLVDIAHQFHSSETRRRSILSSQHFKSLRELRNRSDIIILKLDKALGIVVMNKYDYKNKMLSILSDESKFIANVPSEDIRKLEAKVATHLVK
ncbi:unnamed protein product, partial [Heterobilharzia americana]